MNAAVAEAERRFEVRGVARRWRAAGLIDDASLVAIEARFPDDRHRAGTTFRVLLFLFTVVAGAALFGLVGSLFDTPAMAFAFAPAFAAATEITVVRWRWAGRGPEEASALLAFVSGLIAVSWSAYELALTSAMIAEWVLLAGALMATAAVWRWGLPPGGAVAAGCLLLWLASLSRHGRLLVAAGSLLLAVPAFRCTRSEALAPSHRRAGAWALVTTLGFLVLSTNLASLDDRWLEHFGGFLAPSYTWAAPGTPVRLLAAVATAVLPLVVLAFALRLRDRLLLLCGTVMVLVSLATLRRYVHVAPLWVILTLAGAAMFATAALIKRLLDGGANGERGGFTTRDLVADTRREALVDTVVALAASAPAPRQQVAQPALESGDGAFGGGGASGEF